MRRFLIFLVCLMLGAAGAVFGARGMYLAPGPLVAARDVVVHHGDNRVVAASLQAGGVLSHGTWPQLAFRAAALLTRGDGLLHAAEFSFPVRASIRDVLQILRHARPVQHRLTIPEGLTAAQITILLRAAPFMSGDVPSFTDGALLPQTIDYAYGASRAGVVRRLAGLMRATLATLWAAREPDPAIADPHALVTLASMVERETALPADRPIVARVFLNRLHDHMRLQSDPTVIYAATHGAQTGGLLPDGRGTGGVALAHADLATPSPYNTYVSDGLPPGPICAPGFSALEAAAHPAQSDALYFVAGEGGVTNFAATLDAHNHNVATRRHAGH